RNVDEVFAEARVLEELQHGGIIRTRDADYVDATRKSRPYLVLDYFEGLTLEEHVRAHGPLAPADVPELGQPLARAPEGAPGRGVYHRDVKPANLLVRREGTRWELRLIDFGLALRPQAVQGLRRSGVHSTTVRGRTIAGTLDYAAPEQMGKLPEVPVGAYSD